jgi:NAD(P)-dependent dehydrogenase (short-subunit alcohol dehydrogenase family)
MDGRRVFMSKPICAVVGVGPGNGAALARRFSREGYAVALLARSTSFAEQLAVELGDARAFECDASRPDSVERAFSSVAEEMGEVDALVYNAGSGTWGSIEEIDAETFEMAWRVNSLGALVAVQKVVPAMKRKSGGDIVFIGATASRRGGAKTAAFASAKAAQRSLAESMARHLWPDGIHVALVIIDGIVDLPRTREQMPEKPDSFFVHPDDLAETTFALTRQPRSAWSFEVEARPFGEVW